MKRYFILFFRKTGLIKFADNIRFLIMLLFNYKSNCDFKHSNPSIVLPPPYFMYETFGLNYCNFHNGGIKTTEWLVSFFKKYKSLENLKVLDWGCGPGRIIRHLPNFMDETCRFFGTDYNNKYIQWCKKNLPDGTFIANQLNPPLQFENDTFDIIYGISIFTHLSKEKHIAWFDELMRILKPEGILFLTLHGNVFAKKLTQKEKILFEKGELVIRSSTKEGHRTYTAFQPKAFVKKLSAKYFVLEHVEGIIKNNKPQQDVWIISKTKA
jgi:ubiquinone/menaquinone biosynthesis C-methylase UbiE